jgi:hypothetical protein
MDLKPNAVSRPCANPHRCNGTARLKIEAEIQRHDVVAPERKKLTYVCDKCGYADRRSN